MSRNIITVNNTVQDNVVKYGGVIKTETILGSPDDQSLTQFAEELARIKEMLLSLEAKPELYVAVGKLADAARNNDKQSFRETATKYAKNLSVPFFAHMFSDPLIKVLGL